MSNEVEFSRHELPNGYVLGQAHLNVPKSLNALSLNMIKGLYAQLSEWKDDDSVVAVWMDAAGDKAFCAGGDVVQLHASMVEAGEAKENAYAQSFFSEEYELNYLIHTYPKPILCWGNGIVMGGGVGLMSGCSHRVVTESSRIAMPEITIGLFPDVAGSWFLSRMPGQSGLFLGLTGASINAGDALYVGYGDHFIKQDLKEHVFETLLANQSWSGQADQDRQQLSDLLANFESQSEALCPESIVQAHQSVIDELCGSESIEDVCNRIMSLETEDKWLSRAAGTLNKGCPATMKLVAEQLKHADGLSLSDVFRMEFNIAMHCAFNPDFREGVRALLIDKDGAPQWRYAAVEDVPDEYVANHFTDIASPHPLAHLN